MNSSHAFFLLSFAVPITWKDAPEEQFPIKGNEYLVKCEVTAKPAPSVDWLRNGEPIKTGGRYIVNTRGLQIKNVQQEDDGVYTCRAVVIETGELAERNIKVEVQVKPIVELLPESIEATEGKTFTYKCNATGKPPPAIEWIKDKTQQNLETADRFQVDSITGLLTIKEVKDEDYGTYTCVAKNNAGISESKTLLDVLVTPKIFEFNNVTIAVKLEGAIYCKATGRPAPSITFK